jgi:8-oxo-dGTP pyrophosphatase MutT (NUDIX family)
MIGDGDGWVQCAAGHRHWGRYGAAGVLISDGRRAILAHRASWTHEGDQWGLPGGARDSHEDPTSTALREADEEAAIEAGLVEPLALSVDDHGGWSYTTVLARPAGVIVPRAANAESTDVTWWDHSEIEGLPLHHGLAAAWPRLHDAPARLARASARFPRMLEAGRPQLDRLVRRGIPAAALPNPAGVAGASTLLPRIVVFGATGSDHRPSAAGTDRPPQRWWQRNVSAIPDGPSGGDIESVGAAELGEPDGSNPQVVIVAGTSDRRVGPGGPTVVVGPDWLVDQLDRHSSD